MFSITKNISLRNPCFPCRLTNTMQLTVFVGACLSIGKYARRYDDCIVVEAFEVL